MFIYVLEMEVLLGFYNGVVFNLVINKCLVNEMKEVLNFLVLIVLALVFVMCLVMGEMVDVVLDSICVLVDKI